MQSDVKASFGSLQQSLGALFVLSTGDKKLAHPTLTEHPGATIEGEKLHDFITLSDVPAGMQKKLVDAAANALLDVSYSEQIPDSINIPLSERATPENIDKFSAAVRQMAIDIATHNVNTALHGLPPEQKVEGFNVIIKNAELPSHYKSQVLRRSGVDPEPPGFTLGGDPSSN